MMKITELKPELVLSSTLACQRLLTASAEEAVTNKLVSFAIVGIGSDGIAYTHYHNGGQIFNLIGGLEVIKRDILDKEIE